MHFELEEYSEAADVLKILINMNPDKKDYWLQLSAIYSQLDRERDSLGVLSMAHRRGLFDKETEYMQLAGLQQDRKSTRLNSSHVAISYAVFCLKKKKKKT